MANALLTIAFDATRPVGSVHRALADLAVVRSCQEMEAPAGRQRFAFGVTTLVDPHEFQARVRAKLAPGTNVLGIWY